MRPILVPVLVALLASAAEPRDPRRYRELLAEAARLRREVRPGDEPGQSLDRAFEKLSLAAALCPERWEAFALAGVNRCDRIVVGRQIIADVLNAKRARNASAGEIRETRAGADQLVRDHLRDAWELFTKAELRMKRLKEYDRNQIDFASAAMKYAGGEYLKDRAGGPGAIDLFKALVKREWKPDYCAEFVARSYNQLAVAAFAREDYPVAQEHWDKALRWAQEAVTKRLILSNKAGAFEMDNEFGSAERILKEQTKREPHRPVHWKNLGLVLGHQNKLKQALYAYGRARELCEKTRGGYFTGPLHGNAWLKAAMIHGKLLEQDGDLLLAWKLFRGYRAMLGDDYNFSLNFGEFAFHMGAYQVAWIYLRRARELQPYCPIPYQYLLQVATRLPGKPAEVRERIAKTRQEYDIAKRRYLPGKISPALARLCSGVRDAADGGAVAGRGSRLDPDPLRGFGPTRPPPWIVEAARDREPFAAHVPPLDEESGRGPEPVSRGGADATDAADPDATSSPGDRLVSLPLLAAAAVLVAGGLLLLFRRRASTAA